MNDGPSFETALTELDAVVRDLEDGSLTLDASLARYEQGVALLRTCYDRLRTAEQKIEQLTGVDEDGKPLLQAFEHIATVEKVRKRPRKDE